MRRRMVIKTPEGGLERLYSVVSGGMLAYPRNPTGLYRWLMSSRLKLLLLCTFAIMFTFFSYDTVKRKVPRRIIRCSDSASQLFLQELVSVTSSDIYSHMLYAHAIRTCVQVRSNDHVYISPLWHRSFIVAIRFITQLK